MLHFKEFTEGDFLVFPERPKDLTLLSVTQIHSNKIVTFPHFTKDSEADGIIISYLDLKEYALGIKTADCLPILYLGETHTALIHAGWRGVQNDIIISSKLKKLDIHTVYIGPGISESAFEVQEDFKDNFPGSPHFKNISGRLHFDLALEARDKIKKVFPLCEIKLSNECTFNNKKYHSYRRDNTVKRNWNIFKLKKDIYE